jgi:hypothetical protein
MNTDPLLRIRKQEVAYKQHHLFGVEVRYTAPTGEEELLWFARKGSTARPIAEGGAMSFNGNPVSAIANNACLRWCGDRWVETPIVDFPYIDDVQEVWEGKSLSAVVTKETCRATIEAYFNYDWIGAGVPGLHSAVLQDGKRRRAHIADMVMFITPLMQKRQWGLLTQALFGELPGFRGFEKQLRAFVLKYLSGYASQTKPVSSCSADLKALYDAVADLHTEAEAIGVPTLLGTTRYKYKPGVPQTPNNKYKAPTVGQKTVAPLGTIDADEPLLWPADAVRLPGMTVARLVKWVVNGDLALVNNLVPREALFACLAQMTPTKTATAIDAVAEPEPEPLTETVAETKTEKEIEVPNTHTNVIHMNRRERRGAKQTSAVSTPPVERLTVGDAAVMAGVSNTSILNWIRSGRIEGAEKVGGAFLIPLPRLEAAIAAAPAKQKAKVPTNTRQVVQTVLPLALAEYQTLEAIASASELPLELLRQLVATGMVETVTCVSVPSVKAALAKLQASIA